MEFQTNSYTQPPKNLYPCLATITIHPAGSTDTRSRCTSAGSFGSGKDEESENPLKRVISGGRRKSSFGAVGSGNNEERRKSIVAGVGSEDGSGKWYWRAQAGVDENQLVLMPLTQPPNPLLTTPPQPLSHALPAHSAKADNARSSIPGIAAPGGDKDDNEHQGIGTKIKNMFRRGSTQPTSTARDDTTTSSAVNNGNDNLSEQTSTTATAVEDRVLDQTPAGEMLPSAQANSIGATNVNANAESGWPGVINGDKLKAVVVDLRSVNKQVTLCGGKKGEGSWVIVQINSNFGNLAHSMMEPIGKTHHSIPKSGTIRFDFDKDWIGAKGEAELLHHYLTTALENLPPEGGRERAVPQNTNFQLGGGHHTDSCQGGSGTSFGSGSPPRNSTGLGGEIAPGQRM